MKKSARVLLCLAVLAALIFGASAAMAAPGYYGGPSYGPGYNYGPRPGHRPPPPGYGPRPGYRPPPPPPPRNEPMVWVMPGGQAYHQHWCKFIQGLRGLIRLPISEARRRGYRHCRTCFRY
ncbi:MAG: hypothetical protein J6Z30_06520 [Pyramidobacter sp.]|nr:hypothetical protein [Pyramidobacter sp.]